MAEYPIGKEGIDAVARIIYERKIAEVVFDGDAKAIINAFLVAERVEVEHDEEVLAAEIRPVQRLVSPWRPSEEQ